MDDILIFAPTEKELNEQTCKVLQILKDNDLYLKPEKCEFRKQCLEYLGHIISPDQVEMDPTKLDGITKWPYPTKTKDIRKFIGFCNYYRKFIHHYTNIARPLNNLLSKNKPFVLDRRSQDCFQKPKERIPEETTSCYPQPNPTL
jgi:hypothetical protein